VSVFVLLLLLSSNAPALDDPIKIDSGLVHGTTAGVNNNVQVYRGIPYAAPPVGQLRWKAPQAVKPWKGVRNCADFGSSCLYVPYGAGSLWSGPEWDDPAEQNEDCLYLNVWTGAKSPDEKRPVMVWIHGGGLTRESGSVPAYGGANLASEGVVSVTINYRLGPFGFMAHPDLSKESEHGSSGNYGVIDQISALKWVQRNIASFGGDPERVTIFGESAGSWSVCFLTATPLAKGLFHRAIGQSGGNFGPMVHLSEDRHGQSAAEKTGLAFAKKTGSKDKPASLKELRALPAKEILSKFGKMPRSHNAPNVDGWVFPDEVAAIYEQGKQNPVNVIVGSNGDEGTMFIGSNVPDTVEAFKRYAESKYGNMAGEFLKAYSVSKDSDVREAYIASVGDDWFTWQMRTWARLMATVNTKAYQYHFTREPPIPDSESYGSYHGAEIVYVIGNFHLASFKQQEADKRLAETMSGYWINFAKTGNPNGEGLPEWPAYDSKNEYYMEFGDTIQTGQHLLKERCDFFYKYYTAKRTE
jgi:para-nitrobenzyl esterase